MIRQGYFNDDLNPADSKTLSMALLEDSGLSRAQCRQVLLKVHYNAFEDLSEDEAFGAFEALGLMPQRSPRLERLYRQIGLRWARLQVGAKSQEFVERFYSLMADKFGHY